MYLKKLIKNILKIIKKSYLESKINGLPRKRVCPF